MARADYPTIRDEIANVISNGVSNVKVLKESEIVFGMDDSRIVGIYLQGRSAPAGRQRLANGETTDFLVTYLIRCLGFHLETIRDASDERDKLLGQVEVELMKNRDLNGTVSMSWLNGGDVFSVFEDSGFISVGDIELVCALQATTN